MTSAHSPPRRFARLRKRQVTRQWHRRGLRNADVLGIATPACDPHVEVDPTVLLLAGQTIFALAAPQIDRCDAIADTTLTHSPPHCRDDSGWINPQYGGQGDIAIVAVLTDEDVQRAVDRDGVDPYQHFALAWRGHGHFLDVQHLRGSEGTHYDSSHTGWHVIVRHVAPPLFGFGPCLTLFSGCCERRPCVPRGLPAR